ncbi:MAG: signal peptide peptidase SppA [Flavobacteriaceae bacterium]|jgi:protease-4|nr:signal peptide peptidase SppA [Flavobacteriaceae bacterium]
MKKFFGNVFVVIVGNFLTFILIFSVFGLLILMSMAGELFQSTGPKNGSVLELTFDSPIKESSMDNELSLFGPAPGTEVYFRDIIRTINAAKEDDKIKGISLKVSSFIGGASQLTDIRNALVDFKESGKFIYAYSHNSTQGAYVLNSVADSIFQNPMGMVIVQGMSAEVMFFKNLGDKYGIDFQVIRHGEYKSAVEPYMRDDLSEENREQLSLLLNDIWGNLSEEIAKSRKISLEEFNASVDSLHSFNPEKAVEFKLVDKLAQEGDYERALANRLELEEDKKETLRDVLDKHTIGLAKYAATLKPEKGKDRIAVLYASGAIMPGEGYSGIQSEVYKKAIRELQDDDKIKAVVLRVNSPGGSADSSEEILYELRELRKIKPVVVSFGDVAASGGYYIAMEADAIFSSPNTITGSIGVLGMIPSAQKLVNNIGITTDYVNTNENSDFLTTVFKPMSSTGIETMTEMTENVYGVFVNHVMNARNMSFEEVDSIGGGRVWSGTQALKLGLVDQLGTLEDAIQAAAEKAELENYSVMSYPFRKGGFEEFLQAYQVTKAETMIQQELGEKYFQIYQQLKTMREFGGVQLRMPFDLTIK